MFFVDDHQPEVGHRRQDRRAGTDDETLLPATQSAPGIVALSFRQLAVEHGHAVAEPPLEAPHHLPGEGDLRDQDDGAASLPQRLFGGAEVDQGLAAAGDTLEQGGEVDAFLERLENRLEDRLLIGVGLERLVRQAVEVGQGVAHDLLLDRRYQAAGTESAKYSVSEAAGDQRFFDSDPRSRR